MVLVSASHSVMWWLRCRIPPAPDFNPTAARRPQRLVPVVPEEMGVLPRPEPKLSENLSPPARDQKEKHGAKYEAAEGRSSTRLPPLSWTPPVQPVLLVSCDPQEQNQSDLITLS